MQTTNPPVTSPLSLIFEQTWREEKKKRGGGGLVGKKNEVTECGRGQKCGDYLTALPFLRLLAQLLSIKAPKKSSRHLIYNFIYSLISSGMPSTTTRVEIAAHRR